MVELIFPKIFFSVIGNRGENISRNHSLILRLFGILFLGFGWFVGYMLFAFSIRFGFLVDCLYWFEIMAHWYGLKGKRIICLETSKNLTFRHWYCLSGTKSPICDSPLPLYLHFILLFKRLILLVYCFVFYAFVNVYFFHWRKDYFYL